MKRLAFIAIVAAGGLLLVGCTAPSIPSLPDGGGSTQEEPNGSDNDNPLDTIPATWPSEVPIPDGEIVAALDLGTGWAATVKVADPQAEWEKTAAALKAEGFTALEETSSDGGSFGAYENDAMHVQVTAIPEGQQDGPAWHVTIVKKG